MKVVIDTWTWVEILSTGPLNKKAAEMLRGNSLVTTTANLYELRVYLRRYHAEKSEKILASIIAQCESIIPISNEIAKRAADIKVAARGDIGAVDCFVLAAAQLMNAKLISGDPHFKGYPDVELIGEK